MSRLHGRKKVFVIGAVCALLAAAGAYAFWTAGGSGTGTATTASGTTALTVNQTTTLAAMFPGDTAQTISGTFTNTNSGPIQVATVTAAITGVTKAGGAGAGACDSTDFTLTNAAMTVGAAIPVGTAVGAWTGAAIQFNNKAGTNQDGCKGATVALSYTIA
jgi:hypothetical protein